MTKIGVQVPQKQQIPLLQVNGRSFQGNVKFRIVSFVGGLDESVLGLAGLVSGIEIVTGAIDGQTLDISL